eukprot:m.1138264 g.1138264  ORF g.1138264 m.1138264 type:complete len:404 (-) comp24440_c0_seq2:151-1362(-)
MRPLLPTMAAGLPHTAPQSRRLSHLHNIIPVVVVVAPRKNHRVRHRIQQPTVDRPLIPRTLPPSQRHLQHHVNLLLWMSMPWTVGIIGVLLGNQSRPSQQPLGKKLCGSGCWHSLIGLSSGNTELGPTLARAVRRRLWSLQRTGASARGVRRSLRRWRSRSVTSTWCIDSSITPSSNCETNLNSSVFLACYVALVPASSTPPWTSTAPICCSTSKVPRSRIHWEAPRTMMPKTMLHKLWNVPCRGLSALNAMQAALHPRETSPLHKGTPTTMLQWAVRSTTSPFLTTLPLTPVPRKASPMLPPASARKSLLLLLLLWIEGRIQRHSRMGHLQGRFPWHLRKRTHRLAQRSPRQRNDAILKLRRWRRKHMPLATLLSRNHLLVVWCSMDVTLICCICVFEQEPC